ncbi:MAG: tetratricopeptide repeat protein, partial [Anaerolineae bacterium]|nr:tetratricopeptide repeat protein [Anaerolineae bacterium]
DGKRPWIAALDGEGSGLVQVSTRRLKGRKLFVWGTGTGGQAWQRWLSDGSAPPYLEIQAGLARTQLEHVPMPAHANWSWLEGYGLLQADPDRVHGEDWAQAREAVTEQLEALVTEAAFEAEHVRGRQWLDRPPAAILWRGSGWGALEAARREQAGEPPFCTAGLVFDAASLTAAQAPWLALLREGHFPPAAPDAVPEGIVVEAAWRALLEAAVARQPDAGWLAWLHLGVMRFQAGEFDAARAAWVRSVEHTPTAWALRNLAVLDAQAGDHVGAAARYEQAHALLPDLLPLTVETGQALLAAERAQDWLDLVDDLPDAVRTRGRIRLLETLAALAVNDLDRAEALIASRFVMEDQREGEISLGDLWLAYHARRAIGASAPPDAAQLARIRHEHPIPPEWDFSMNET